MAPHHIDDLPRREDTRQLMLGLIDTRRHPPADDVGGSAAPRLS
jgi:hypothetical protein